MTRRQQIIWWAIGFIVLGIALFVLRSVLLPFVAGMAVAYFLDPITDRLESWRLSRTFATLVVLLTFFIAVLLLLMLVLPVLQHQIFELLARLPEFVGQARETLQPLFAKLIERYGVDYQDNVREAMRGFAADAVGVVGRLLRGVWSGGVVFFNIASLVVITPIVAFYLLRDWDRIVARVDSWLPRQHEPVIRRLIGEIDDVMAGFIRGQGTVCLILGTFYALALSLTGLDFGLVIGIFAGLVSFVPFVGAILGLLLSVVPAITQFWPDFVTIGIIVGIFAVGQALEGNFLTPRLLGDRIGLHPVWVIFALLAGGALFGFLGILLAVPLAAAFGVLVRFFLSQYMQSRLYLGPGGAAANGSDDTGGEISGT